MFKTRSGSIRILALVLLFGGSVLLLSGCGSGDAKLRDYQLQQSQQQLHDLETEYDGYRDGVKDSQ